MDVIQPDRALGLSDRRRTVDGEVARQSWLNMNIAEVTHVGDDTKT